MTKRELEISTGVSPETGLQRRHSKALAIKGYGERNGAFSNDQESGTQMNCRWSVCVAPRRTRLSVKPGMRLRSLWH